MKRLIIIQLTILTTGLSTGVTSGGVLSREQLAIDINHYDLRIKVDTTRRMISGYGYIKMKILEEIRFIELDLIKQYFISKLKFLRTKKVAKVKIAFSKEECNKSLCQFTPNI